MHRMPGARHIDAIRAVVKAFLPRAVRMDVHVSGGHDLARGIDDRIRSDAIRTAGGLEIVIRRASRRDRAIGVGHDPSMFLDAAGVDFARVPNREGRRRALHRVRHLRDDLLSVHISSSFQIVSVMGFGPLACSQRTNPTSPSVWTQMPCQDGLCAKAYL